MSTSDGLNADTSARRRKGGSPFLVLAAGLLLFAAVAATVFLVTRPTTLRIAVGPSGSADQNVIQALSEIFARESRSVRLTLITTAGPVESIELLRGKKTDLAVVRADEDLPNGTETVAILRKNVVVLWSAPAPPPASTSSTSARKPPKKDAKPKVKSIDDLEGHRVGVIGRTPVNITLLRVILTESGINPDKVAVSQFSTSQVAEMVRDPTIDAFMTVGPLDSKITADAISATARARGEPTFLPIEVSETIEHKHPLYESEEIPGSVFSSSPARPDDKIDTVGVNHLIVAPKSLSETEVGAFIRALFTVRPSLIREDPNAAKIQKPDTDKDAALPAHPGAAAYIDGTERTFLDKYSDYFWGAILVFSALGSLGAWMRHYLKRDERLLTTEHRDRLLAAITQVRKMDTIEELDAAQHEADELLRETLECYDDGAIEEGDLSAYGLVLEQFRHAMIDRRAAINAAAGVPRMRAS
ncbi:TAXI family TRAP transporter solute-binding subunit [Bradyrhizobium sp. dw_411]|uniref:TAXI family TRAP transporter solute-binding subunit n=1 Tax=Bradyrhizobium sp. dw_411 TaxID=2720082 RepID=UPI001BD107EF|nr:TAXI family TRAP transporter solute-binding subunit [Bradyrhizobium sp. dw_411]